MVSLISYCLSRADMKVRIVTKAGITKLRKIMMSNRTRVPFWRPHRKRASRRDLPFLLAFALRKPYMRNLLSVVFVRNGQFLATLCTT